MGQRRNGRRKRHQDRAVYDADANARDTIFTTRRSERLRGGGVEESDDGLDACEKRRGR